MKNLFYLVILISGFLACNNASTTPTTVTEEGQFFGEKITTDNPMDFNKLVAEMNGKDSLNTKFIGTVESVCQTKGCWVNIKSESGEEMFVKFKDYGFFMPKDCSGKKVVMEGTAFREVTPVDELRHYAEDEGLSAEEIAAITEPKEELKFMANGVVLLP